jgi:hypothetical protein
MKILEFFQEMDDNVGKLSMSRLVFFLSFFPASWHVVTTHQDVTTFITTYAGAYLVGKHGGNLVDAIGNKGNNAAQQNQDKDEGPSDTGSGSR